MQRTAIDGRIEPGVVEHPSQPLAAGRGEVLSPPSASNPWMAGGENGGEVRGPRTPVLARGRAPRRTMAGGGRRGSPGRGFRHRRELDGAAVDELQNPARELVDRSHLEAWQAFARALPDLLGGLVRMKAIALGGVRRRRAA